PGRERGGEPVGDSPPLRSPTQLPSPRRVETLRAPVERVEHDPRRWPPLARPDSQLPVPPVAEHHLAAPIHHAVRTRDQGSEPWLVGHECHRITRQTIQASPPQNRSSPPQKMTA